MFSWLSDIIDGMGEAMGDIIKILGTELSNVIFDSLLQWLYTMIYDAIADFFTMMGNMGADIFDLQWVKATVQLFTLFGWSLFVAGTAVAVFDLAIEYQSGRANPKFTMLNILKGFFACSLTGVLPVELYKFCISLQNTFAGDLTRIFAGQQSLGLSGMSTSVLEGCFRVDTELHLSFLNFLGMLAFGYCVVKIFFANISRGGILLIQMTVGSLYMFSVPRGYTDGFNQWMLALYGQPTDGKTADRLVKCFKEDQTDNQLVAAVNKTFGTNVVAEIFTKIMNSIRSTTINISDYVDPSTKNNLDLVKWAKHAEKSGWGYVWGTYGGVLNKKTLDRKSSQYPNEVGSLSDFIRKNWLGGRTADCVGLIKGYGWLNPETLEVEYGTNGMKDVGADGMYKNAKVKGPIDTMPEVPGLAVWHKGHIGIYIGNGEVIEAMSTKTGVKKTKFSTKRWSHWLEIPYIQYIDEASVH